ncbi:MAG: endonuclease III [Candidatus Parvarchaeota archaeon]|nr:endonuclease III [Candidatus Parvarchaeota archaeon]
MDKKELSKAIEILRKRYNVKIRREKPFEILVHGILSTRTKDTTTFPAQKRLLRAAGTPYKLARMKDKEIEKLIYPVGFYKTKAKLLKRSCAMLIDDFGGKVPSDKKDLMKLPGVGHKVAALVLVWAFGLPYIPVDTHVNRVSKRWGVVGEREKPERTEEILESMLPDRLKIIANHTLVMFGRDICKPVRPMCYRCPVYSYCAYKKKEYYRRIESGKLL